MTTTIHVSIDTTQTLDNKTATDLKTIWAEETLEDGTATPDLTLVPGLSQMVTVPATPVTITNLLNGYQGQIVRIRGDGATIIQHNAATPGIRLRGALDLTPTTTQVVSLQLRGTVWYEL